MVAGWPSFSSNDVTKDCCCVRTPALLVAQRTISRRPASMHWVGQLDRTWEAAVDASTAFAAVELASRSSLARMSSSIAPGPFEKSVSKSRLVCTGPTERSTRPSSLWWLPMPNALPAFYQHLVSSIGLADGSSVASYSCTTASSVTKRILRWALVFFCTFS